MLDGTRYSAATAKVWIIPLFRKQYLPFKRSITVPFEITNLAAVKNFPSGRPPARRKGGWKPFGDLSSGRNGKKNFLLATCSFVAMFCGYIEPRADRGASTLIVMRRES
jgi:hypothetical protein